MTKIEWPTSEGIIPVDAVPGEIPATCCHMPVAEEPKVAAVYRKMRELIVRAHCADKRPTHRCAGTVSIDRATITLNCPRCGDLRKIIEGADGQ
jgi:hypothetical protein